MPKHEFPSTGVYTGVAKYNGSPVYRGRHRENDVTKGIGFIPLGDRSRDITAYGVDSVEERYSIDKYTKWLQ